MKERTSRNTGEEEKTIESEQNQSETPRFQAPEKPDSIQGC